MDGHKNRRPTPLPQTKLEHTTAAAKPRRYALEPKLVTDEAAEPRGTLFVAAPPKYQDPISVSLPFCVSMAAFLPTLLTSERKAPK